MARFIADPAPELVNYHPEAQVYTEMAPKVFLENLGELGVPGKEFYVSQRSLDELKARMIAGEEIDPLFIDYNPYRGYVVRHEGRHRALAAAQLGIDRIPVIVWFYDDNGWHDVKNEEGTVYDQSHYVRLDELGEARVNTALDKLGAERAERYGLVEAYHASRPTHLAGRRRVRSHRRSR